MLLNFLFKTDVALNIFTPKIVTHKSESNTPAHAEIATDAKLSILTL